jgi:hypothetical protein
VVLRCKEVQNIQENVKSEMVGGWARFPLYGPQRLFIYLETTLKSYVAFEQAELD